MREEREPFLCVRNPVGIGVTSEPEFPGVQEPQASSRNALGVATQTTTVDALATDGGESKRAEKWLRIFLARFLLSFIR